MLLFIVNKVMSPKVNSKGNKENLKMDKIRLSYSLCIFIYLFFFCYVAMKNQEILMKIYNSVQPCTHSLWLWTLHLASIHASSIVCVSSTCSILVLEKPPLLLHMTVVFDCSSALKAAELEMKVILQRDGNANIADCLSFSLIYYILVVFDCLDYCAR